MKLHVKQHQGSLGMIHMQLNVFLELPLGVFSEMYFLFIINGVCHSTFGTFGELFVLCYKR